MILLCYNDEENETDHGETTNVVCFQVVFAVLLTVPLFNSCAWCLFQRFCQFPLVWYSSKMEQMSLHISCPMRTDITYPRATSFAISIMAPSSFWTQQKNSIMWRHCWYNTSLSLTKCTSTQSRHQVSVTPIIIRVLLAKQKLSSSNLIPKQSSNWYATFCSPFVQYCFTSVTECIVCCFGLSPFNLSFLSFSFLIEYEFYGPSYLKWC